jgi:hypothetical protein
LKIKKEEWKVKNAEKYGAKKEQTLATIMEDLLKEHQEQAEIDPEDAMSDSEDDSDNEGDEEGKVAKPLRKKDALMDDVDLLEGEKMGTRVFNAPLNAETSLHVQDIQSKLANKVLPLLSHHIMEDENTVRPNILVSVAQISRKLTPHRFNAQLYKLFTMIATGLRCKFLA